MIGRAGGVLRFTCSAYKYLLACLVVYAVLACVAFGWKPVMIVGGSMSPAIAPGDLVLLEDEPRHPLPVGAVVTFRTPGMPDAWVTHRVTEVLPDGYRTRGDANVSFDSHLLREHDVVGAGRLLVPALGRPMVWLQHGQAEFAVLWLLLTLAALAASHRQPVPEAQTRPTVRRLVRGELVRVEDVAGARPSPVPRHVPPRRPPPHLRVYGAPRLVWA